MGEIVPLLSLRFTAPLVALSEGRGGEGFRGVGYGVEGTIGACGVGKKVGMWCGTRANEKQGKAVQGKDVVNTIC